MNGGGIKARQGRNSEAGSMAQPREPGAESIAPNSVPVSLTDLEAKAREMLEPASDWSEKLNELYTWTGSAFLAGEPVEDEEGCKSALYSFLCGLIGYLQTAHDATAALSATGVTGWLPIDSAPKDGTPILIWQPRGQRTSHMPVGALKDGEYHYKSDDPRLQWFDDQRWAIGYWRPWGSWGNRNSATVEPTHWQPLPTPPVIQSEGPKA